jgi:hypothetical protein
MKAASAFWDPQTPCTVLVFMKIVLRLKSWYLAEKLVQEMETTLNMFFKAAICEYQLRALVSSAWAAWKG